jgi:hypothetical protein
MTAARSTARMTTGFFQFNGQGDGGLRTSREKTGDFPMSRKVRTDSVSGNRAKPMPAGIHCPHPIDFHPAQSQLPLDRLQTQSA